MGDKQTAAKLALLLLFGVALAVWFERAQRRRAAYSSMSVRRAEAHTVTGLAAALLGVVCATPVVLGLLVPIALLALEWGRDGFPLDPRMGTWIFNTFALGVMATAVIVPLALGLAYASRAASAEGYGPARWRHGLGWMAQFASLGYAVPGVVMAVGLLALCGWVARAPLSTWMTWFVPGSVFVLLYAYVARFFAVGLQGSESALGRIHIHLDQAARSLGLSRLAVLHQVHWPIARRAVLTTSLLVLVDCLKELPATLILRPFNFDTLAVVSYQFASDEQLVRAAAPALAIALIGLVPVALLAKTR
jgi:iron(III) transport system permease protein